jgi:hypothetical protein
MDESELLEELITREIEQTEKKMKNTDQRENKYTPKIDMLNWILDDIEGDD